jgi:excisionase family DNA binding protein
MYTVKEVAEALGVGRTTVWKALSEGNLSAVKLGHRTLVSADSLRSWIASLPRFRLRHAKNEE